MSMYPIASYTAPTGGSGSAVWFYGIPQNFTHLQFRLYIRSGNVATTNGVYISGNSYHSLNGNGSTVTTSGYSSVTNGIFTTVASSSASNIFSCHIVDIFDYASTTKNKTIKVLGGYDTGSAGWVELFSAMINSTSAINQWFFDVGSPNYFAAGSRIDLYGITSSNVGTF